ncbi:MAG: VOC family protein, partial [Candidatus Tectomicrobia bacterium]|nr:VOC family protein [Candidatus Tectomicrobia bacterium]
VSVALYSPKPDETVRFFHDLLGLEISHCAGQSVYLRAYEDFYQYTLKITEATQPGLEEITWRAASAEALARRVAALEASGLGQGWRENDYAHGPAYAFTTPDGHRMKILWELDYFSAPDELRSKLRNRPSKRPLRGVPVRRIDHVNLMVSDVPANRQFMMDVLGFRLREQKIGDGGAEVGAWMSVSALVHELAMMRDATGSHGRFHHVAYWYGASQHLLDIADVFSECDVKIEAGPAKHGATQAYFLYAFEPGGNRVELFGDAGYLIFDPNWQTVVWNVANEVDLEKSSIWFGGNLPKSFYQYGTPPVSVAE